MPLSNLAARRGRGIGRCGCSRVCGCGGHCSTTDEQRRAAVAKGRAQNCDRVLAPLQIKCAAIECPRVTAAAAAAATTTTTTVSVALGPATRIGTSASTRATSTTNDSASARTMTTKTTTTTTATATSGRRRRHPLGATMPSLRQRPGRTRGGGGGTCALLLAAVCLFAGLCLLADTGARATSVQVGVRARRQANDEGGGGSSSNNNNNGDETITGATTSGPSGETTAAAAAASERAPETSTAKPRIAPVNYTRVDELFEAVDGQQETVAKWRKLDKTLQSAVGGALKIIFPHIVSMASDAKVSGSCSGAILKWILNLKGMRTWAVRMLDAIGKPSAGLLEGSLTLFGNYKQCLSVRAPDEDEIELSDSGDFREYFRGQYCVLQVRPPLTQKPRFYSLNSTIEALMRKSYKYYEKSAYDDLAELAMAFNFVNIRADLCVPSLCSRDDIQRVADFLVSKVDMRARVLRCETHPFVAGDGSSAGHSQSSTAQHQHQHPHQHQHQHPQQSADNSHLWWSIVFLVVLLLVLGSTLTSLVFRVKSRTSKSKTKSLFTSMSVYRSLSHMRDVQLERINDSKPVVLYSLRLIFLLWICLVNLTSQLNFQYLRELLALRETIMLWPMQLLVNSSLAWDSLILLTAFTYSYQNVNSNLSDLVKYNLAKYTRLMPSVMLLVALTIVTPLLYAWRSPLWHDFVDEPAHVCKTTGFVNLFFLQNMLPNSSQVCLPQTWLLCVELQLCLLCLPLVYMMNKSFDTRHGAFALTSGPILFTLALALLGCALNFVNTSVHQLPAAWFLTFPDRDDKHTYFTQHLYKTTSHLTAFAVGLFTGHLCRCQALDTFSGRPYGRRCCDTLMWLTAGALMFACIFSTHSWSLSGVSHLQAPLLSATYAALAPLLWSVGLSLVLFQLTVPNELSQRSSLAILLTSDVNVVRLGRLSFLAYLINPYVNTLIYALQEQAIFSSVIMLAHTLIGNLVITFALAFVVSALVELPCRRLLKKLLIGSRRQSSNLDIITRQLDMRQREAARPPARPAFSAANAAAATAPHQKSAHYAAQQQQQQQAHQSVMIPLK